MASAAQKTMLSQDSKRKKERDAELEQNNKMGQEIEDIFRANKKKKMESPAIKRKGGKEKKVEKKKYLVNQSSESTSKRRRTADGLAIYSAEELGIGNPDAGSTPLCPFDCSCCF